MSDPIVTDIRQVLKDFLAEFKSANQRTSSQHDDPWSHLDRLEKQIADKIKSADPNQDFRADRLALFRARQAVHQANNAITPPMVPHPHMPNPLGNFIKDFEFKIGSFKTSIGGLAKAGLIDQGMVDGVIARVGASSVGRGVAAMVASGAIVPVLIAAAGVAAFVAAVQSGMDRQRSFANTYYAGGGSSNMGSSTALGGFAGMDGQQTAELANSLGDKLRQGGYAASLLHSYGVIDNGVFTTNKFDNLSKTMDALRQMPEEQAIEVARQMGMSNMLRVRDLDDDTYNRLKHSRDWSESKEGREDSAYLEANKEIVTNWFHMIGTKIENGAMTIGAQLIRHPWDTIKGLAGGPGGAIDIAKNVAKDKGKTPLSATKELTQEVKTLTRTIKDQAEVIGGGRRTRGAVGLAWRGVQFDEANRGFAQSLGAFMVG